MNDERRFGIADGLILIAGAAAGLGLVRYVNPGVTMAMLRDGFFDRPAQIGWTPRYAHQIITEMCVIFVTPFVAAWTPACLLLLLKRPRPRRLRRSPGFVACLLPTVGCTLTATVSYLCNGTTAWTPMHANQGDYETAQVVGGCFVGAGVLWAWAAMAVCGIYRPRPTWTDRLGRLSGVVWIMVGLLSGAYLLLLL